MPIDAFESKEAADENGRGRHEDLLDQCYFVLSEEEFKKFAIAIDKPPNDNPALARLMKTRAPWEG